MIPYKSKTVFNFNHALIQFRRINVFTCLIKYIAKDILVNDYMKFKISFVKRRKLLELKRRFTFDKVVLSMSQFSTLSYQNEQHESLFRIFCWRLCKIFFTFVHSNSKFQIDSEYWLKLDTLQFRIQIPLNLKVEAESHSINVQVNFIVLS